MIALKVDLEANEPQRLDLYLAQVLPDLSRSRLQKLIAAGHVQINGQVCTAKNNLIQRGDQLSLIVPEPENLGLQPQPLNLDILYEDDHLLIINKPAGLVVHPAPGHADRTLVNALLAHCPLATIGGVHRPGIVHRLDKDTTGAIAIAKTDLAYRSLQAQLQAKTARREYLGIVCGTPKTDTGTVEQPIGRSLGDRKKMAIHPEGRPAITHWQIIERLGNFTVMQFRLETGRTHQIRVHSAFMGCPIVGDPLYGKGRSVGVNLPGQALHAHHLQLIHPISGQQVAVTAPIPTHLQTLWQVLKNRDQHT
jgi:23S rRNA pseudouridine1911/1915/1917 synthase